MTELKPITACIVDDETPARAMLRQMLQTYTPHVQVVGEADSVDSAIKLIKHNKPDVLFLDIQMPDGNGFDVLESAQDIQMHIIFVTAYNDYALRAIKFHAFDYLLKPLSRMDIIKTISDLNNFLDKSSDKSLLENFKNNAKQKDVNKHSIAVTSSKEIIFIPVANIVKCEADAAYTRLFLTDGTEVFSSKNLGEFEKVLPTQQISNDQYFFRIHHSTVINMKFVKSFNKKTLKISMLNGEELVVAQRRKVSFLNAIQNSLTRNA